jgi:hypothetical protein
MNYIEKSANRPANLYSQITLAKPSDADELWIHLRSIEDGFGNGKPTDDAIDEIVNLVVRGDHAVAGIAREHGKIIASVGLSINKLWYSDDFLLADAWHYVAPAHRRSPYAKSLVKFAKKYADNLELPLVMTVQNTEALQPKIRLYERELEPYGGFFEVQPKQPYPIPEGVFLADSNSWTALEPICRWIGQDNAIIDVNYDRALEILKEAVKNRPDQGSFIGVVGDRNNIRGAIAMKIQQNDMTKEWQLTEHFVAVPPGKGSTNVSGKLIEFAKWAGSALNLPLQIGIASRKRTQTKLNLYRRKFGEPKKLFFYYKG